jgi:hypothetical protein
VPPVEVQHGASNSRTRPGSLTATKTKREYPQEGSAAQLIRVESLWERQMADFFRVVVPVDTKHEQSWSSALSYAVKMARASAPPATDVVLLTHTKKQLDLTMSLAAHIGPAAITSFAEGRKISLGDGVTLRHETLQTLGNTEGNTVVIAFYADANMLKKLKSKNGISGVVAVPNLDNETDLWIRQWDPNVHDIDRERPKGIDDPVLKEALESITWRSNIAGNVLGPGDKLYATEVFRVLRAKGHTLEASSIEAWAIRRGWNPRSADHLSLVAKKIAKLKGKPSLKGIHDPAGRYNLFKTLADRSEVPECSEL